MKNITDDQPLSYLLKNQPFMDFDFYVDQNVLIPRPETEELVEVTIQKILNLNFEFRNASTGPDISIVGAGSASRAHLLIADVGTGSGCIAVSLAKYFPAAKITAVESSPSAMEVAKQNAKKHRVLDRIEFIEGDFLFPLQGQKFDLIVSNPPYIPTHEIPGLDSSVKDWEPHAALDGGRDGLFFIRKLILEGPEYLKKGGMIIFEFGFGQGDAIRHLAPGIEIIKDLAGIERIAVLK